MNIVVPYGQHSDLMQLPSATTPARRPQQGAHAPSPAPERLHTPVVTPKEDSPRPAVRRSRTKRKATPILVFDDPNDEDYEESPKKKPRKTYIYDSEGAIDAEIGSSSSEDVKLAPERKHQRKLKYTKVSRKSPSNTPAPRKCGTSDARRKSEQASNLLKRKGKGRPIPKHVEDCDEADLMMWQWKQNGRSWKEIRAEHIRIVGVEPGRSSLSVRLAKMEDNFIDNGCANDLMLLKYKEQVENELEVLKWQKISAKMKKEAAVDMSAEAIRKRYQLLKESGWRVGSKLLDKDGHKAEAEDESKHSLADSNEHPRGIGPDGEGVSVDEKPHRTSLVDYSSDEDNGYGG
ncbi:uncharacterized protein HMPREF1541_07282 [Cyphellophora europaea CBS 101466]|uniref:Uncharacterized protein n=1 Tax=Cyphellophora europaea (strain CBS 101466) TaxID=1220924 RepID=W2RPJ9_CYPE1|nr:uncharacterized protein HMPREF1541_07282 [Cyphellophora europaea CBS 101466]ETN37659.1 hypothetical protein HMPREF1541_07282 [Cyphellophora europaea CBS 101466]